MTTTTTIVTALYDIRTFEGNTGNTRKIDYYLKIGEWILSLPYPMIIFTEDKLLEEIKQRRNSDLLEKTDIRVVKFEDTYFYKYRSDIERNMISFSIYNRNNDKDTPCYIIFNNDKFFFIEEAIKRNTFNTDKFIWIDFGISYVAKNLEAIHAWFPLIPEKVRQMSIYGFYEDISPRDYFNAVHHNNSGGVFSGSKENLLIYSTLFKQKWEQVLREGWYQLDEAIMSLVIREHPELFDLYYGDYSSIICNYQSPQLDYYMIKHNYEKAKAYGKQDVCDHILKYANGTELNL